MHFNDASAANFPADAAVSAPELKDLSSIQPVSPTLASAMPMRAMVLGGATSTKLPTLTISGRLRGRSVLTDTDLTPDEIGEVLETAARLKKLRKSGQAHSYLTGKTLGLIFQHPSTRTRVAFEAGMAQLGGQAIFLGVNDLQVKRGETLADTAQVLSRYVDGIVARVASHDDIEQLAGASSVPVHNGLTDKAHPMQALSDLLTIQERFGGLKGRKVAFLGDGNNVCRSLMLAGAAMGISVTVAAPARFQPPADVLQHATWLASASGATISVTPDPFEAVQDADVVYTDVHVSMGQADGAARAVALLPYKVTPAIMEAAQPEAVFMHCLPMHRDEEVDASVADGPQSIIFDQAENRLHLHKAILLHTLCSPEAAGW